jgi:YD repeat-containing protein
MGAGYRANAGPCPRTCARAPGCVPDHPHRVISYTYDSLYRLITATYSSGESYRYTYDAVGNRLSLVTSNGSTSYEYDTANRLTSVNGVVYT